MALDNYRDLSVNSGLNAGFQFEFYCNNCSRKWKSPLKPYRTGQVSAFLTRFAFLFGNAQTAGRVAGGAADYSARGAKSKALAEAMPQAEQKFSRCAKCNEGFCMTCLGEDQVCPKCVERAKRDALQSGSGAAQTAAGHACPNCGTASHGGRFCAECGFDMASTHKSCPGCGSLSERTARFCGDCGHGF